MFSYSYGEKRLKIGQYLMKLRHMKLRHTKSVPVSWATLYIGLPIRAVRRRAAAADILLTPPPPIIIDRRAAAADRMSASRRRRFRDVFTSRCTPAMCC